MKVFLSYAVGHMDAAIAARLRAVAAAYDIAILLPDRTTAIINTAPFNTTTFNAGIPNEPTTDTLKKIKQSDAVIGLMTRTASVESVNLVNHEIQAAEQMGKPIIALVDQYVPVQGIPEDQVVRFDPFAPSAHESSLVNVLEHLRRQKQWKDGLTALGWVVGITLGLAALSELVGDKK